MTKEILNIHCLKRHPDRQRDAIRVLQITDCHLHSDPGWKLAGINTQTSFESVMSLVEERKQDIDLLLLTGDLVHDASITGYNRLKRYLQKFGVNACCLPGNHDNPEILSRHLKGGLVDVPKVVTLGNWVLILLDSTIPRSEGGHLNAQELQTLRQILAENPDHHALIALHHHPVLINSAWMDKMSLDNPQEFLSILDQHNNVKGVVWGHIHQPFESTHNGIRMLGTPSTCIQFAEKQARFGISTSPPGLRWLELLPDGRLNTGIERVAALPAGLDLKSAGY